MSYISGQPIDAGEIPDGLAARVGPDAPSKAKLMVAKALLPMPPEQLGVALAVLARDEDGEISEAASQSLRELPRNVVTGVAESDLPAPILDVYAHVLREDNDILRALLRNQAVADETVRWMARTLKGDILTEIARNQRRLIREPKIIGALIANPATPTPTLAPVIETALRNGVETARIPGFKQLAEAFFADDVKQLVGAGAKSDEEVAAEVDAAASHKDDKEEHLQTILHLSAAEQPSDEDNDEHADYEAEPEEEDKEEDGAGNLWSQIHEMTVAQKVRLAVMGDASARSLLIRDPKKVVAMAVMKSPRLTLKEVAGYATNKTMPEEVIREIARNREWTKNYTVRLALVKHPKCPPNTALSYLRMLRARDINQLSRARDVPAYVSRAAKQVVERKSRR